MVNISLKARHAKKQELQEIKKSQDRTSCFDFQQEQRKNKNDFTS